MMVEHDTQPKKHAVKKTIRIVAGILLAVLALPNIKIVLEFPAGLFITLRLLMSGREGGIAALLGTLAGDFTILLLELALVYASYRLLWKRKRSAHAFATERSCSDRVDVSQDEHR